MARTRARPLAAVPDLEEELDALYALPLEEFTRARNDLASRLKKAGQGDAAERVKSLPKPSVPAWAVNQLARTEPVMVRELIEAGRTLREASLAGRGAEVREASAAERRVVRALTASARALLGARGGANAERVATLLRTASLDDEARRLLERGRLSGEIEPAGFEALAAMAAQPAPRSRAKEKDRSAEELREARERVKTARADARAERRRAAAVEKNLQNAHAALAAAEEEAEAARAAADEAQARLAAAEAALEALTRR